MKWTTAIAFISLLWLVQKVNADSLLPGTIVDSNGNPVKKSTDNAVPEAQSRPEFTAIDLKDIISGVSGTSVVNGFVILLDKTHDSTIPVAGPPPGNGVNGVPSATEFAHPEDWGDVAQFVTFKDASGNTQDFIYFSSDPEGANKADTGSVLDTIAANQADFQGLSAPTANDTVFLMERNPGNTHAGDGGAGESDMDNKYLSSNVTWNLHSDPPAGPANVAVPEPSSIVLSFAGLVGLSLAKLRRLVRRNALALA